MRSDNRYDDEGPYTGETIPVRRPPSSSEPTRVLQRPRRRPRRSWGGRIRVALLVIAGLVGLLLILGLLQLRDLAALTVVRDVRRGVFSVPPAVPFTMLVVGVDERAGHPEEGVRGDSLIVLRADPIGGWVSVLAIPRDTLVDLPNLGPSKINAAYGHAYNSPQDRYDAEATPREAGMAGAAEAAGDLLGINIDYVAQVNFDGFARIIDALGGVTIDVPRRIVDDEYPTEDFGVTQIVFEPGVQRMDGARALIYARTRHADSDFGRGERQQQVVQAIIAELRGRGVAGQLALLPALRSSLGDTVATTLPFDRPDAALGLARLASSLSPDRLLRLQLSPATVGVIEDGSNLVWDREGLQQLVRQLLRGPSIEAEAARVQVLNGTEVAGLAGRVSGDLEGQGLTLVPAGDAPGGQQRTVVYDVRSKPLTARRVADLLRAETREGLPEGIISDADVVVVLGQDAAP